MNSSEIIQRVIVSKLSGISGMPSGVYYGLAPAGTAMPYISFRLEQTRIPYHKNSITNEVLVQFSIFSDTKSSEAINDIAEYFSGLDGYTASYSGHTVGAFQRQNENFYEYNDTDKNIKQYNIYYRTFID